MGRDRYDRKKGRFPAVRSVAVSTSIRGTSIRFHPASRGDLDLCTAVLESMVYRLSAEMKGICGNGEKAS